MRNKKQIMNYIYVTGMIYVTNSWDSWGMAGTWAGVHLYCDPARPMSQTGPGQAFDPYKSACDICVNPWYEFYHGLLTGLQKAARLMNFLPSTRAASNAFEFDVRVWKLRGFCSSSILKNNLFKFEVREKFLFEAARSAFDFPTRWPGLFLVTGLLTRMTPGFWPV